MSVVADGFESLTSFLKLVRIHMTVSNKTSTVTCNVDFRCQVQTWLSMQTPKHRSFVFMKAEDHSI